MDYYRVASVLNGFHHGIHIKRNQRSGVNNLQFDTLLSQLSRRAQNHRNHVGPCDDRRTRAVVYGYVYLAFDVSFPEGDQIFGFGHNGRSGGVTIQVLMLNEYHRAIVSDGCLE